MANYERTLEIGVRKMNRECFRFAGSGASRNAYEYGDKYIIKELRNLYENAGGVGINREKFEEFIQCAGLESKYRELKCYYKEQMKSEHLGFYDKYCELPIGVASMLSEFAISKIMKKTGRGDAIARVLAVKVINGKMYGLCENAFKMEKPCQKTQNMGRQISGGTLRFAYKYHIIEVDDMHSNNSKNGRVVDYASVSSFRKVKREELIHTMEYRNFIPKDYLKRA